MIMFQHKRVDNMNRTRLGFLAASAGVLLLCAAVMRAGHYTWTTSGPEAGLVFQIGVNPADGNTVNTFAGYWGGYLFHSSNGGSSWSFVPGVFGSSFVQDPSDSQTLYAPGSGGVYRSGDGGAAWTLVSLPLTTVIVQSISAAPSLPGRVYAAGGYSPSAFFRSDDGGSTWATVPSDLPAGYPAIATDPDDAEVLYAVTAAQLYRSINGGANWVPFGTGFPATATSLFFDPSSSSTLYAATTDTGVSKSTDHGATWTPANVGIETQYVRGFAIDPGDSQKLYAAGWGAHPSGPGGLFVSANGGSSWSPIDIGLSSPFVSAIAIDPHNSQRLLVGAGTSVLRGHVLQSFDGGITWMPAEQGVSGFLAYSVAADPIAGSSSFATAGSRVYRSDQKGDDWSLLAELASAVNDVAVDPTDSEVIYGCYQGGDGGGGIAAGVYKSVDGGLHWTDPAGPFATSSMYKLAISGSNPQVLLASTGEGIFQTSNGGGSWSNALPGYGKAVAIDPADEQILYAGLASGSSGTGQFLRSPDGGMTWTAPAGAPTRWTPSVAINPLAPDVVYALFPFGPAAAPLTDQVFRSTDHGLTFSPAGSGLVTLAGSLGDLAVDPSQAQVVYAAPGQGGQLFRTTDGADSWKPIAGAIPAFASLDFSVSATGRTLYAATLGGAFAFDRSFLDVPDADPYWTAIDAAAMNGLSTGCGSGNFCPTAANTRAQIAVFLLRAKNDAAFTPPPATGAVFGDVPTSSFAAAWIEELSREGITSGCGGANYCPSAELSRAEMAVMVLKALHGSDFTPPPATGAVFTDVPADAFAAAWIEELAAEGIAAGCGGGNFCPDAALTRAQAAALLTHAFQLS